MAEQKLGGYTGKILRVNLSDNNISVETIDEAFCRKYFGGAGFVAYFLWKELSQGIDPLGPENKLIFALGPVTGVPLAGSGRHCIGTKSPLTGGFASEIAATIQDKCFLYLEAPVARVCGLDTPYPLAHEKEYMPDQYKTYEAIKRTLKY